MSVWVCLKQIDNKLTLLVIDTLKCILVAKLFKIESLLHVKITFQIYESTLLSVSHLFGKFVTSTRVRKNIYLF